MHRAETDGDMTPQPGKPREIPPPSNPPLKCGRNRWPLGIPSRAACAHAAKNHFWWQYLHRRVRGQARLRKCRYSAEAEERARALTGSGPATPAISKLEAPRSPGAASISFTREFTTPEFRKRPKDSKLASQLPVMIAGNPKSCRTIVACAVVLVLLIVVSTAFIAMRRTTAPVKVVPLHPSTFILGAG